MHDNSVHPLLISETSNYRKQKSNEKTRSISGLSLLFLQTLAVMGESLLPHHLDYWNLTRGLLLVVGKKLGCCGLLGIDLSSFLFT